MPAITLLRFNSPPSIPPWAFSPEIPSCWAGAAASVALLVLRLPGPCFRPARNFSGGLEPSACPILLLPVRPPHALSSPTLPRCLSKSFNLGVPGATTPRRACCQPSLPLHSSPLSCGRLTASCERVDGLEFRPEPRSQPLRFWRRTPAR